MRNMILMVAVLTLAFAVPSFAGYGADPTMASPASADKTAAMHNDAGIRAYGSGDFAGAEEHFREAVKLAPSFAEAHYNLGLALHDEKKHKDAVAEFKLAKKLAPNNKAITESKILEKHLSM